MGEHIFSAQPFLRVHFQHFRQKSHAIGINSAISLVVKVEIYALIVAVYLLVVVPLEEIAVGEQDVQDDSG